MGQAPDVDDDLPAVVAEVDTLRERTQAIMGELERRLRSGAGQAKQTLDWVKRVTDVRAQIKAHPGITVGVASGLAIALGLSAYFAAARRRQARRPMNRLKARLHGYRALLAGPEHKHQRTREPFGERLLKALLIAGATTIVRGLGMLLVQNRPAPRRLPAARHHHG